MGSRIIAAVAASHEDDYGALVEYKQGETVDLPDDVEARLEEQGALVPHGYGSFQEFGNAKEDAYRAGRGDVEAASRLAQRVAEARQGGIADLSLGPAVGVTELAQHIEEQKPNVDDTVALAEGDAGRAEKVLEAEKLATSGDPRKGVEGALQRIIDGGAE